jgi:branched-chain amino acid transport system permease protein
MDILPQLLVNSLIAGSIYAIASSGLCLTYGLLRILNFAHGHFMMVGAYVFYLATVENEWGLANGSLFTILVMLPVSIVCLRVFVMPFTRYNTMLPFVTTLALAAIFEALISIVFGVNVKSLNAGVSIESIEIYGVYITPIQIIIIASALVLMFGVGLVIHFTSLGRKIRAVSESTFAAEGLGISQSRISFLVFGASILMAAFAGIMVGFETNMQPTMGNSYTIKAFAAMILGGLGNVWGTIAGSYILGLVENLSIGLDFWGYSLPAGYKDAFAFVIIVAVLLFRPKGLFNTSTRKI